MLEWLLIITYNGLFYSILGFEEIDIKGSITYIKELSDVYRNHHKAF